MTRNFAFAATAATATAIAALAAAAPAFANDQLIASAGLTAEQAEGLTLNQIVAAKYTAAVPSGGVVKNVGTKHVTLRPATIQLPPKLALLAR